MMGLHAATLFDYLRKAPFGGRISQTQVDGINCILDACDAADIADLRHTAYILATAFHETAATMQPVREGLAKSDKSARKILAKYRYSKPDQVSKGQAILPLTGQAYYGRGYVQLTWADNYHRMGAALGLPLHQVPDLALDAKTAAKILVIGMKDGLFTSRKLSHYFSAKMNDPVEARRIVNGKDKQHLIATYYDQFLGALTAADTSTPLPKNIKPESAHADGPELTKDATTIGGVTATASAAVAGALGAVNSPWAFAAFAVLALGAWLFLTGRIEIKRKAGA